MNAECSRRGHDWAAYSCAHGLVIICERCGRRKGCRKHSEQAIMRIVSEAEKSWRTTKPAPGDDDDGTGGVQDG